MEIGAWIPIPFWNNTPNSGLILRRCVRPGIHQKSLPNWIILWHPTDSRWICWCQNICWMSQNDPVLQRFLVYSRSNTASVYQPRVWCIISIRDRNLILDAVPRWICRISIPFWNNTPNSGLIHKGILNLRQHNVYLCQIARKKHIFFWRGSIHV